MMITNMSSRQVDDTVHTTYKRLDRAYHYPSLDKRILIEALNSKYINTNPIALNSSHSPGTDIAYLVKPIYRYVAQ